MLRHFAPRAALYAIACSLVLPALPLAAEEPSATTTATTTPQATDTAPAPTPTATTPAPPPPPPPPNPAPKPAPAAPKRTPHPTAPAPEPKPQARASGSTSVSIRDFAFAPSSVTVNAGDTVTWTNTGEQGHSATGKGFDTGILEHGHSGSHTFSKAGSFSYICTPHPFMKAKVIVRAASSGGGGTSSPATSDTSSSPSSSAPSSSSATLPKTGSQAPGLALLGGGLLLIGLFTRRRVAAG